MDTKRRADDSKGAYLSREWLRESAFFLSEVERMQHPDALGLSRLIARRVSETGDAPEETEDSPERPAR